MTRKDHFRAPTGLRRPSTGLDADVIVNLQGDEPLMMPKALDLLPELLEKDRGAELATLAVPLPSLEEYYSPNVVKVVRDRQGRALYFSRSPIPMVRDGKPDLAKNPELFLQHLGLYAYRRDALLKLASLPPDPLEQTEKLEQLRVLAMGWRIQVGVISHAGRGVDTKEDYEHFVAQFRSQSIAQAA